MPTQPTDSASIANGGTADVNTATVVGGELTLGPGAVNLSAGTINSGVDYIASQGTFFQSGGLNLPYSNGTGGLSGHSTLYLNGGNYQLSGGTIEAELQCIGISGPGVLPRRAASTETSKIPPFFIRHECLGDKIHGHLQP